MRRLSVTVLVAIAALAATGPPAGAKPKPARSRPAITLAAGDTMLGNSPELPADPGSYLDAVKRQLRGDVVFGNLEGTLTDVSSSPKCGGGSGGDCYAFRTPPGPSRRCTRPGSPRPGSPGRSRW